MSQDMDVILKECLQNQKGMFKWQKRFVDHMAKLGVGNMVDNQKQLLKEIHRTKAVG